MSRLTGHSDAAASGASRGEGPAFFAPQPWNGGNQKQKGIFAWFRGGLWRVVRLSETPFPMFWVFRCGPVSVRPFTTVAPTVSPCAMTLNRQARLEKGGTASGNGSERTKRNGMATATAWLPCLASARFYSLESTKTQKKQSTPCSCRGSRLRFWFSRARGSAATEPCSVAAT